MYKTKFMDSVMDIVRKIDNSIPSDFSSTIDATIVGGVAVHAYTGYRVSSDCDVIFSHKIIPPGDITVQYEDENGDRRAVAYDSTYAPEIGIMHPDAVEDAKYYADIGRIKVHLLSPEDLVVTKLSRWADNDREDVRELAKMGLIMAEDVESRAWEALEYYIGNKNMIEYNIRDAIEEIQKWRPESSLSNNC